MTRRRWRRGHAGVGEDARGAHRGGGGKGSHRLGDVAGVGDQDVVGAAGAGSDRVGDGALVLSADVDVGLGLPRADVVGREVDQLGVGELDANALDGVAEARAGTATAADSAMAVTAPAANALTVSRFFPYAVCGVK